MHVSLAKSVLHQLSGGEIPSAASGEFLRKWVMESSWRVQNIAYLNSLIYIT